jgi:hypothetical protein
VSAAPKTKSGNAELRRAIAVCRGNGLEPLEAVRCARCGMKCYDHSSGPGGKVCILCVATERDRLVREIRSQLELAMTWGRAESERAAAAELSVETWVGTEADALHVEIEALRADVARLREEIGFWERSSVAAIAAVHGIPTPASGAKP